MLQRHHSRQIFVINSPFYLFIFFCEHFGFFFFGSHRAVLVMADFALFSFIGASVGVLRQCGYSTVQIQPSSQ